MRRLAVIALLLAASCQRQAAAPPPHRPAMPILPTPPQAPSAPPQPNAQPASDDASGAADMLRHYFALIETGRYADAWRMRDGGGRDIDAAQFAAHFKAYQSYHSQVGAPSRPVASQGWIWVEVPVMTTGNFLGGKPFGSTGSVTVRRPASGAAAPPDQQGWRIYTG